MACVAGSGFKDRKDERYLQFLEDKYRDHEARQQDSDTTLRRISDRLERIENSKSCIGRCQKLHVCVHCRLRHRFADCKFYLRDCQTGLM